MPVAASLSEADLQHIAALDDLQLILPSSPEYTTELKLWSLHNNENPACIVVPKTVHSLQTIFKYLCDSSLDFGVRSGGISGGTGVDVALSLSAFNRVEFDATSETVVVGSGQTWDRVYTELERVAAGYAVVGCRTPFIGVGGFMLCGGCGWLSHEHGFASDPKNFLDAEVVLTDGRLVRASDHPDLLWALRGGSGNFGVVVNFTIRAYKYPTSIYSGFIHFPTKPIEQLSKLFAHFLDTNKDSRVALLLFCFDFTMGATGTFQPGVSVFIYDAHGEAHARGAGGFKWAFDIDGAIDQTRLMSLKEVHDQQAALGAMAGQLHSYMHTTTPARVLPDMLSRSWEWYGDVAKEPRFQAGSFVLAEPIVPRCFDGGDDAATAWPHGSPRHVIQLGVGYPPGVGDLSEAAVAHLAEGARIIPGEGQWSPSSVYPNYLLPGIQSSDVYGGNFARLQEVKRKYDPRGRLHKGFFIPPQ